MYTMADAEPPYNFAESGDAALSNRMLAGLTSTGTGLCLSVLLTIAFVAWDPVARVQMDRVSFRILVVALGANMFFGAGFTACATVTHAGFLCSFATFITQFCLDFSSWLIFSIALNLQLVLVHGVNGQNMEKFYIIFSAIISLCTSVPPYAYGQYGYDPLLKTCWYSSGDDGERLRWQIGTQLFWTTFIVVGETACFLTVLGFMLKHQLLYGRYLTNLRQIGTYSTDTRTGTAGPSKPFSRANRYRNIIIRIGLYPLASWVLNLTTVALDIFQTVSGGILTVKDYHLFLVDNSAYGSRPIVYALLAATDPALHRALRTRIRRIRGIVDTDDSSSENRTQGRPTAQTVSGGQITVHIELQEVRHADDGMPLKSDDLENKGQPHERTVFPYGTKSAEAHSLAISQDDLDPQIDAVRRAQITRTMEQKKEAQQEKEELKQFKRQL